MLLVLTAFLTYKGKTQVETLHREDKECTNKEQTKAQPKVYWLHMQLNAKT